MNGYLLVNFGGPRHLDEIAPFLIELLCDRDVIRTPLPVPLHSWFFSRVARKRALRIRLDYEELGGGSPIYFDTETIAQILSARLKVPGLTFHRDLPATHAEALQKIKEAGPLTVLPLFPQFCYATTGSVARFFSRHSLHNLFWIRSYAGHPAFISAYQKRIADFLQEKNLKEEETFLLFSAHGIPKSFLKEGETYQSECETSFHSVMKAFPRAKGMLAYQSKFGRGEWLRPYTNEVCEEILTWHAERKNVVIVPITFTSDHIETLFEIEKLYLPPIVAKGLRAFRCPALNTELYWLSALEELLKETHLYSTSLLVR